MKTKLIALGALCTLLLGCGTKQVSRGSDKHQPIEKSQHVGRIDSVTTEGNELAQWHEERHTYRVNLAPLTKRYMYPRPAILDGRASLSYAKGKWMEYLQDKCAGVGVRIDHIALSIPGHLAIVRTYEAEERQRAVDCLIHPRADKKGIGVVYNNPHYYSSENMAVRELFEFPDEGIILIIDHLRDRNTRGDLAIVYVIQDAGALSPKERKQYRFLGHLDHNDPFTNRCITYQYIQQVLSPITISLQPSCRYQDFEPRHAGEEIPKEFLVKYDNLIASIGHGGYKI